MPKPIVWIAGTRKDMSSLPASVRRTFGFALHLAQNGARHEAAKPLRGFGGAGVLEVVEDAKGGTYRAVYTVRLKVAVFVLHMFQKKSTSGIATPKPDLEIIRARLQQAVKIAEEREDE